MRTITGNQTITRRARAAAVAALLAALLAATLAVGSATPAGAATTTVSGTVNCNSNRGVTGIWVSSSAGGSGWAGAVQYPGRPGAAFYSKAVPARTTVSVHVGCGGTSKSWASDNWTPGVSVSGNRILNFFCNDRSGPGAVRCASPNTGRTTSRNLADAGYCTWGAIAEFRGATGLWPNWSGNAAQWASTAAANGWTVTAVPMGRSIMVVPASTRNSFGHVRSVRAVHVVGGRILLDYAEMNAGGHFDPRTGRTDKFGQWSVGTMAAPSGVTYINEPNVIP